MWDQQQDISNNSQKMTPEFCQPGGGVLSKKRTVLIADDNHYIRAAMKKRLTAMGYDVVEAENGLGVLSHSPLDAFDLIMLDQEMPFGDGRSVARVIRKETDVPILFVSGHDREEFRSIVMELSDVYYLKKPIDHERLTELLASLFEGVSA